MKRLLAILEEVLTRLWIGAWVAKMPGWFEDLWAGVLLVTINVVRRVRFGVRCGECQGCGMAYPPDDLSDQLFRDGSVEPECTSCTQFRNMLQSLKPHWPKAA